MRLSACIIVILCSMFAFIQSCDSEDCATTPCEPESIEYTNIILYYKDHPTCFRFDYDLEVELDDGDNYRYWMQYVSSDPNLEYPNSPPLAVYHDRDVEIRFSYSDKNPQIGPTSGSFYINTGSHSVIYISFFAVASNPCLVLGESCDSLVTIGISEDMKCEEGIDSIFVSWVYR